MHLYLCANFLTLCVEIFVTSLPKRGQTKTYCYIMSSKDRMSLKNDESNIEQTKGPREGGNSRAEQKKKTRK